MFIIIGLIILVLNYNALTLPVGIAVGCCFIASAIAASGSHISEALKGLAEAIDERNYPSD